LKLTNILYANQREQFEKWQNITSNCSRYHVVLPIVGGVKGN